MELLPSSSVITGSEPLGTAITNKAQDTSSDKIEQLRGLHDDKGEGLGPYTLDTIYNMDQTLLPFDYNNGKTHATTGSKSVQVKGTGSGLDKRQATVRLCIHADGINDVKPTIIFRGTGQRIKQSETKSIIQMWQRINVVSY